MNDKIILCQQTTKFKELEAYMLSYFTFLNSAIIFLTVD